MVLVMFEWVTVQKERRAEFNHGIYKVAAKHNPAVGLSNRARF